MTRNSLLKTGYLYMPHEVTIRKEYFGGIVFHKSTGVTLEIDDEAYQLLRYIKQAGYVPTESPLLLHAHNILPVLLSAEVLTLTDAPQQDCDINGLREMLTAPETVHLAVTYRCSQHCPDCYARGFSADKELDTEAMCGIIDDMATHGVFQLAIGGGEPFVRQDIKTLVQHATSKGLVVHVTTGRYSIKNHQMDVLKNIQSLHVGIRSESLITDTEKTGAMLQELVRCTDIAVGANLIITRFTIRHLHRLVKLLVDYGFQRLIFLRYKPIQDEVRWQNENPSADDFRIFIQELSHIKHQYRHIMIRLDCASAFLMRDTDSKTASHKGIKGCVAGNRIISVSPDGSVYPCSQLVGEKYCAGNLTQRSFSDIWNKNEVLSRYRRFRKSESYSKSVCGKCMASEFCGGCRVFADDVLGGEQNCPIG